jgi:hypothetical protein
MKHSYILLKTTRAPAGRRFTKYVKEISFNNVSYTRNRLEAKRLGLLAVLTYSFLHNLSTFERHPN